MASWHSCNVLGLGADTRRVWQFDARSNKFGLNREQVARNGDTLPSSLVGKGWTSLWKRKLNVAWLPPENVFVRVAHFPASSPEETRSMVELQLEKLSPIPVTQAVWNMHVLPHADGKMQTVVLTIASRDVVEEFLGKLESHGFLADRLELPMIDQLQMLNVTGDGAWIFPEPGGLGNNARVAWFSKGVLQNLDLLTVAPGVNRAEAFKEQLMQMAWAGELEGWLIAPPQWHLVANDAQAAEWEPPLREGLGQPVPVVPPPPDTEVAATTARRAVTADPHISLLPPEHAARYQQQLVDRLWMRGLGAALVLYLVVLAIYFVAVSFLGYQTRKVEVDVARLAPEYTNTMQFKARYDLLKERGDLKFAGLDAYEAVAETMPEGIQLESLNFTDGWRLSLAGTADKVETVLDFHERLRRYTRTSGDPQHRGEMLFDPSLGDPPAPRMGPGGSVAWNFWLGLKRSEKR